MSIEERRTQAGKVYIVRPYRHGRRLRAKTFRKKPLALAYEAGRRLENERRSAGLPKEPTRESLADWAARYLRDYAPFHKSPNTVANWEVPALRSLVAHKAGTAMRDVDAGFALGWKAALLKTKGTTTVAAWIRHLRAIFQKAVDDGDVVENPFAGVDLPKSEPVGRVLSNGEIHGLLAALLDLPRRKRGDGREWLVWRFVVFDLHTGMREADAINLDWRLILRTDEPGALWRASVQPSAAVGRPGLYQPKNRKPRIVPLFPWARFALGEPRAAGPVFQGLDRNVIQSDVSRAATVAGIGRVRAHDIKHTFCTRFVEAFGDVYGLSLMTGNSLASLRVYLDRAQAKIGRPREPRLDYEINRHFFATKMGLAAPPAYLENASAA